MIRSTFRSGENGSSCARAFLSTEDIRRLNERVVEQTALGCLFCGIVSFQIVGYSMSIPVLIDDFGCSEEIADLGTFTFVLAFGAAPLVLAPLSEEWGRHPVSMLSSVLFALWCFGSCLAQNITTLIVLRFFSGACGSTAVSLVGGILGDIFRAHERGLPMFASSPCPL